MNSISLIICLILIINNIESSEDEKTKAPTAILKVGQIDRTDSVVTAHEGSRVEVHVQSLTVGHLAVPNSTSLDVAHGKEWVQSEIHKPIYINCSGGVFPKSLRSHNVFVDRKMEDGKSYLQTIYDNFTNLSGGERLKNCVTLCALNGMGGVGKTTLAIEYAWQYGSYYDAVFWINASSEDSLKKSYVSFLKRMSNEKYSESDWQKTKDELVVAVVQLLSLSSYTNFLLVCDNAECYADIEDLLSITKGHVLCTSRHQDWRHKIDIDLLAEDEAIDLLYKVSTANKGAEDDIHVKRLVNQCLGRLALAITQAGSYMRQSYIKKKGISFEDYIRKFDDVETRIPLLEYEISNDVVSYKGDEQKKRAVMNTWQLTMDVLNDDTKQFMNYLYYLVPDAICINLFYKCGKKEIEESVDELVLYSMINRNGDYVSIHRLVQCVGRIHSQSQMRVIIADIEKYFNLYLSNGINFSTPDNLVRTVDELTNLEQQVNEIIKHNNNPASMELKQKIQEERNKISREMLSGSKYTGIDCTRLIQQRLGISEKQFHYIHTLVKSRFYDFEWGDHLEDVLREIKDWDEARVDEFFNKPGLLCPNTCNPINAYNRFQMLCREKEILALCEENARLHQSSFSAKDVQTTLMITSSNDVRASSRLNLYAVHAMYNLPVDGKLIAGACATADSVVHNLKKGNPLPGVSGWRPTLHFSIGGLASDLAENTLSTRPYALIIPLTSLVNRVIGFSIDTFRDKYLGQRVEEEILPQCFLDDLYILGDLEIPNESALIVPARLKKLENEHSTLLHNKYPWIREKCISLVGRREAISLKDDIEECVTRKGGVVISRSDRAVSLKLMGKDIEKEEVLLHMRSLFSNMRYVLRCQYDKHPIGFIDRFKQAVLQPLIFDAYVKTRKITARDERLQLVNRCKDIFERLYKLDIVYISLLPSSLLCVWKEMRLNLSNKALIDVHSYDFGYVFDNYFGDKKDEIEIFKIKNQQLNRWEKGMTKELGSARPSETKEEGE